MISSNRDKHYPSAKTLVHDRVASRLQAKDASLYSFSAAAQECAEHFMGWADLASNPPYPLEKIQQFADDVVESGIKTVVLIGQGGSTQAPMTLTKYRKPDGNRVDFRVLDSDSPVRVRKLLAACDPQTTLVIIASKSGGTIEPRLLLSAVRDHFAEALGATAVPHHLVAITDPGSALEAQAAEEGWLATFPGEPSVGGRFSALSVFGLLPAALAGINLEKFIARACEAERACSEDSIDNPAIGLATFLYENNLNGRNKFSFFAPQRGRVLGLWIEQLVAESLGKDDQGILPLLEVDPLMLTKDSGDASVIVYHTKTNLWDERTNFEMGLAHIDPRIPRLDYRIEAVEELAEHFVLWEYAIAMAGYLMKVCPFDQPDVASAKAIVLDILRDGMPDPDYVEIFTPDMPMGNVEVRQAPCFSQADSLADTLQSLIHSIEPGDYFAVNAFLPFTGEGRREALESIRHGVRDLLGTVACLEIGPRYLHSTGQLQKGGPNCGVFLILSADEMKDIPLTEEGSEAASLGELAKAQATGDFLALAERDRRCVHLHLPDNAGITLRKLAQVVKTVVAAEALERELLGESAALYEAEVFSNGFIERMRQQDMKIRASQGE